LLNKIVYGILTFTYTQVERGFFDQIVKEVGSSSLLRLRGGAGEDNPSGKHCLYAIYKIWVSYGWGAKYI
jgi:hypothetical protein